MKRLLGGTALLVAAFGAFVLAMRFPGRSVGTGYHDSGISGWVCIILIAFALFVLFGTDSDEPPKPPM